MPSALRLTAALWHAIDCQAHVVSMSLGGPLFSFALHEAIEEAIDAGMILAAAAGNQWPFVVYPARYDEVIACAACNVHGKRWSGSAQGSSSRRDRSPSGGGSSTPAPIRPRRRPLPS